MNFVIIASPRTGSTHLVTTLSGHPEIFCNGNIFKKSKVQLFWPKKDLGPEVLESLSKLRDSDPKQFLEEVYSRNYGKSHVGFKIFQGQNDILLHQIIESPIVKKIVLFRGNVLANYSSWLAAKTSGRYSQSDEQFKQIKVFFVEDEFMAFHRQYIHFYKDILTRLNRCSQSFYFFNYEDINEPRLLSGACSFIGADTSLPIVEKDQYRQLVKQNSPDILDRFSNSSKVKAFLRAKDLLHWRLEHNTTLRDLDIIPRMSVELDDV